MITAVDDPQHEAELADGIGTALFVVLETLSPPERVAFVLHDLFVVPFDEIASLLERTPEAARQLASRARRCVRGATPHGDAGSGRRQAIVDAFLAAAREGDFDGLLAVLDPRRRAPRGPRPGRRRHRARRRARRRPGAALRARPRARPAPRARQRRARHRHLPRRPPVLGHGVRERGRQDRRVDILVDRERLEALDLSAA